MFWQTPKWWKIWVVEKPWGNVWTWYFNHIVQEVVHQVSVALNSYRTLCSQRSQGIKRDFKIIGLLRNCEIQNCPKSNVVYLSSLSKSKGYGKGSHQGQYGRCDLEDMEDVIYRSKCRVKIWQLLVNPNSESWPKAEALTNNI